MKDQTRNCFCLTRGVPCSDRPNNWSNVRRHETLRSVVTRSQPLRSKILTVPLRPNMMHQQFLSVVYLPNVRQQLPVEHVAPDRHLELVKWVLHDVVGVEVVYPPDSDIDIGLGSVRE